MGHVILTALFSEGDCHPQSMNCSNQPGKIDKLLYFLNGLTDCHKIWQGDAH